MIKSTDDLSRSNDMAPRGYGTGAARRFSLRTLMVIIASYSVVFGVLTWMQMPPLGTALIAGFVTVVGVAQAVVFGGRRPREASLLAGSLLCSGGCAIVIVWCYAAGTNAPGGSLLIVTIFAPLLGAGLGYIAGCFIGGAFLSARRRRLMRPPGPVR
jgi:hypothetical protein